MEIPKLDSPQALSPSNSGRRRSTTDPNSPEFEFWMVRNPSFPQPHLSSADELFNNGVLLPLDLVPHLIPPPPPPVSSTSDPDPPKLDSVAPDPDPPEPGPGPESTTASSASKRWRDIFKMGEKKAVQNSEEKSKEKKKERKVGNGGGGGGGVGVSGGTAELNINIWPFSRSHSAGTGGNRPRLGGGSRKVSSAPCSRSNSAGESKSRKWPNSPGRGGIHLGRNSPVWQVRRGGSGLKTSEPPVRTGEKSLRKEALKVKNSNNNDNNSDGDGKSNGNGGGAISSGGGGGKGRGLNLNVPMCIGYRQQLSCRSDEGTLLGGGGGGGESGSGGAGNNGGGVGGGKIFNLRTLFTKKVY